MGNPFRGRRRPIKGRAKDQRRERLSGRLVRGEIKVPPHQQRLGDLSHRSLGLIGYTNGKGYDPSIERSLFQRIGTTTFPKLSLIPKGSTENQLISISRACRERYEGLNPQFIEFVNHVLGVQRGAEYIHQVIWEYVREHVEK